jgi:hypothetical protein
MCRGNTGIVLGNTEWGRWRWEGPGLWDPSIPQTPCEDFGSCEVASPTVSLYPSIRKLIHHRKETLSRRGPSSSSAAVMTPSTSDHHLDAAATRQPNGMCRTGFERQHSLPSSEHLGADGALYQVPGEEGNGWDLRLHPEAQGVHLGQGCSQSHSSVLAQGSGLQTAVCPSKCHFLPPRSHHNLAEQHPPHHPHQ